MRCARSPPSSPGMARGTINASGRKAWPRWRASSAVGTTSTWYPATRKDSTWSAGHRPRRARPPRGGGVIGHGVTLSGMRTTTARRECRKRLLERERRWQEADHRRHDEQDLIRLVEQGLVTGLV